jgi:hypothetical protein
MTSRLPNAVRANVDRLLVAYPVKGATRDKVLAGLTDSTRFASIGRYRRVPANIANQPAGRHVRLHPSREAALRYMAEWHEQVQPEYIVDLTTGATIKPQLKLAVGNSVLSVLDPPAKAVG